MKNKIAFCFLAVAGALAFLVALYTYANKGRYGDAALVLYAGLPLAASVFFLASLFLKKAWRNTVAVSVASAVVAVYAVETYFHLFAPMAVKARLAAAPSTGIDPRAKLDVIGDFRRNGVDAYPYINSAYLSEETEGGRLDSLLRVQGREIWPIGSLSGATVVVCREGREYLSYETDERGFNNPPGTWTAPAITVAAVGNSYVHGECVPPDKNMISLLRDRIEGVLNLGVSGVSALTMLGAIREYLPAIKPRYVFWFFFEDNDLTDLMREKNSPLLSAYLKPDFTQGLADLQPEIDAQYRRMADRLSAKEEENRKSKDRNWFLAVLKLSNVRLVLGLVRYRRAEATAEIYGLMERVLIEADQAVRSWGGRLVFVYMPGPWRYHPYLKAGNEQEIRARMTAIAAGLGLPVVDLHSVLVESADDPLDLFQGHLTEEGNRLAAAALGAAILDLDGRKLP